MIIRITDKSENINMKGANIDMGRKSKDWNKERFSQMDIDVVNQVKEEVMGMVDNHVEEDKEMIQEMEKITREETAVGYESANSFEENSRSGEVINLGEKSMPSFGSLSEKMKNEESGGDDKEGKFNTEDKEVQNDKDELKRKREASKLRKQMKDRLDKLNSALDKSWEFANCQIVLRDNMPYKYTVSLSCMQLAEMYIAGQIFYKSSEQRGEKHTKSKGDIPLINIKHTKDILNAIMSSSSVDGGCIYLNYAKEYNDELIFDTENNSSLSGSFPLSVNDGAHRLEAMKMWYYAYTKSKDPFTIKNPNDFYFPVIIQNLDNESCRNIFVELNSFGLPISKTRIAFHDVFNPKNVIAQKVMDNCFRGKIEVISNSLKKTSPSVMTFGTLLKGCSLFSPATKSETTEVSTYLCEYWNEIIELFPKIYGNVSVETKQIEKMNTFIGEVMFIHALFGLAVELQSVEDWKEKLKKLKEPSNFLSRDNDLWIRNITRNEGKLINTSKTQDFVKDQLLAKVMG